MSTNFSLMEEEDLVFI